MKTYTIDYRVVTFILGTYHPPKIKVKNCYTELEAKIKLEKKVERDYKGFVRMEVIGCVEDFMGGAFNDIFEGLRK